MGRKLITDEILIGCAWRVDLRTKKADFVKKMTRLVKIIILLQIINSHLYLCVQHLKCKTDLLGGISESLPYSHKRLQFPVTGTPTKQSNNACLGFA
jgi:hypothetical protein